MRKIYLVGLVLLSFVFNSCKKEKVEAKIPSYISIDSFTFTTDYATQGSNSHNITDVWLYIDDQFIGAYEIPAKVPVLMEGSHNITVRPGIKNNGISSTRTFYRFYSYYYDTVELIPDSVITIKPSFTYNPEAIIPWMEDFENSGVSFQNTGKGERSIAKTTNPNYKFEGGASGEIIIDDQISLFEIKSPDITSIPLNATPVYLEMDFRSIINYNQTIDESAKHSITIGVFVNDESVQKSVLTLAEHNEWRKIYIDLSNAINIETTATSFNITLGIQNQSYITSANIYIDNVKLIHF